MRVLLVEDEAHKIADLTSRIGARAPQAELTVVSGVREAVLNVTAHTFDLIVLDMALPIFADATEGGGGGGQPVGGIEVLRAMSEQGKKSKVIIVTQFPGVAIGGKNIRFSQLGKFVAERYGQELLGAVLYKYRMPEWERAFDALIGKMR